MFKTKFEQVEHEPVFEEELHGPLPEEDGAELEHETTHSSTAGSVEEEDAAVKKH